MSEKDGGSIYDEIYKREACALEAEIKALTAGYCRADSGKYRRKTRGRK